MGRPVAQMDTPHDCPQGHTTIKPHCDTPTCPWWKCTTCAFKWRKTKPSRKEA